MTITDRNPALWAAAILIIFALFMLVGFPLRFDGAMPWEMLNV